MRVAATMAGLLGLLASACDPAAPSSPPVKAVLASTSNPDGTRTVARRVNGQLEGRTLVYLPTGEIESIFYFHHDSAEGVQRRFYPGGQLATWQQMHQGQLQGDSYEFFDNGALAKIERYAGGQHQGRSLVFYDHPRNQLFQYIDYTLGDGHEWKNRFVQYDTLGRATDRGGFLQVRALRDTVALGDSLTLNLQVRYPKHNSLLVATGDYDAQYHLRDASSVGELQGRGHAATLRLPATQRGQQVVRGYFADVDARSSRQPGDSVVVAGQRLYFSYPYFVR